jgi:hypothetical protein
MLDVAHLFQGEVVGIAMVVATTGCPVTQTA